MQLAVGLITHICKVETRLHRPWSFLRLFNFHCLTYIRTRRISTQSLREDAAVTALRLGSGTIILYTCLNVRPRRAVPDSRAPLFFADTETWGAMPGKLFQLWGPRSSIRGGLLRKGFIMLLGWERPSSMLSVWVRNSLFPQRRLIACRASERVNKSRELTN